MAARVHPDEDELGEVLCESHTHCWLHCRIRLTFPGVSQAEHVCQCHQAGALRCEGPESKYLGRPCSFCHSSTYSTPSLWCRKAPQRSSGHGCVPIKLSLKKTGRRPCVVGLLISGKQEQRHICIFCSRMASKVRKRGELHSAYQDFPSQIYPRDKFF